MMRRSMVMVLLGSLTGCPGEEGVSSATMGSGTSTGGGPGGTTTDPGVPTSTGPAVTDGVEPSTGTTGEGTSTGGPMCTPGTKETCYSGPPNTVNVGLCAAGERACGQDGVWGACVGEVLPAREECGSPGDEDCDGVEACAGKYPWSKVFGGVGDWAVGVGVDAADNVVLLATGEGQEPLDFGGGPLEGEGGQDLAIAKFAPDGTHLWSRRFSVPFAESINPMDLMVAADGRLAVSGTLRATVDFGGGPLYGSAGGTGFFAVFDPDGAHLASRAIKGVDGSQINSIALGPAGRIGICGHGGNWVDLGGGMLIGSNGPDIFCGVYDASGEILWDTLFDPDNAVDKQFSGTMFLDATGNMFLGGDFEGTFDLGGGPLVSAGSRDAFLAKLSPQGDLLWSKRFGTVSFDSLVAVVGEGDQLALLLYAGSGIDLGGGPLKGDSNNYLSVLAALDATGAHQWSRVYPKVAKFHTLQYAGPGALFTAGNLLDSADLGGGPLVSQGEYDVFGLKLTADGSHTWSARFGDPVDQTVDDVGASASGVLAIAGRLSGIVDFGDGPHPEIGLWGQPFVAVFKP